MWTCILYYFVSITRVFCMRWYVCFLHAACSTSLMVAAANGHRGVCDYLISSGADLTLLDKLGTSSTLLSLSLFLFLFFLSDHGCSYVKAGEVLEHRLSFPTKNRHLSLGLGSEA